MVRQELGKATNKRTKCNLPENKTKEAGERESEIRVLERE